MRNVLVVLISLCASPASGFIVPSGVPEFVNEESALLADNADTNLDEMKLSTIDSGFDNLPINADHTFERKVNLKDYTGNIDEKSLYEHATNKANILNERSFLYINQRFKTPIRDQLYNSHFQGLNLPVQTIQKIPMTGAGLPRFRELPTRMSAGLFQPSIDEYNVNLNTVTEYTHRCNDKIKIKGAKNKGNKNKNSRTQTTNRGAVDQRSYLELLKPPLLRPLNYNGHNLNVDDTTSNQLFTPTADFSDHQYSNNYPKFKPLLNKNQNSIKANSHWYTLPKPTFLKHQVNYKPIDTDIENYLATDEVQRTLGDNSEEERQLDRYLKDTYGEQVTNERMNVNYNDCNYQDCVIGARKQQYIDQSHKDIKSQCKCRRKLNIRDKNANMAKERPEREEINRYTTPMTKSSEINEYDDILKEEISPKPANDELIKTVSKLNDTLQMY